MKILFIVFFVFLGSLFFREQRVPDAWVDNLSDRFSTSNIIVRCEGLSFGFRRGLHATGIRVYERSRANPLAPVVSVRSATVNPFTRLLHLVEPKYLRLPDSYYVLGNYKERNSPLEFEFPRVPTFRLVAERSDILGLTPKCVTARVKIRRKSVDFESVHLDWPDEAHYLELDGMFRFDLASQKAHGEVRGLSTQSRIRPLLVSLDLPAVMPYFDAFTDVTKPVPAEGIFDVDLTNNDFRMRLDLKPTMGRYNGVAMTRAEGVLNLWTYIRGTNCNVRFNVDLAEALDPEGRKLSGDLTMNMSNDLVRLSYDVSSFLAFRDALEIADFIEPETLDMVVCETKPIITVKGTSGVSAADAGHNNLAFTAKLERGSFLGLKLSDLTTDFTIIGERMNFSKIDARGKTGGHYTGNAWLDIPGYDENRITFGARVACAEGSLKELVDVVAYDLGELSGKVNGWIEVTGPARTNCVAELNGKGSIKISDGHLAQMKLFAGLTKLLAEKVPGVGFLVNQSEASADFTISNGVFRSENVFIEGGFFSLKGWGAYDIAKDDLDFTVRVQFMKNDSLLGKLVHPVTFPFTKLLLEYKAKGPLENPQWEYISLLDRIL